jgi:cell division protein FtsI (penicillin-binding protein 3)
MTRDPHRALRVRLHLVAGVFALAIALIAAKAVHVQLFQGDWLSEKAAAQYQGSMVTQGQRGTIYDRNLHKLAASIDVASIGAFPKAVEHPKEAARLLGAALDLKRRDVERRLASSSNFVWIKRQVTPREAKNVESLALRGIQFVTEPSRIYPQKTVAAQILGFSGVDGQGLEGLEFFYNERLSGDTARLTVTRDALGRGFQVEHVAMPDPSGNNLVLTLDRTIQYNAEVRLAEAVAEFGAKSGIAIVMQPATGAILAQAHYPLFNPNAFKSTEKANSRNRAITDPFEPGSTMKIFTAAVALEAGVCSPATVFNCENGNYRIGSNTVHDTHPHGWLPLSEIVKVSSNIGAIKIAELLGHQGLYEGLRRFGIGQKTGIDSPGETSGSIAPWERWRRIDGATIAFGQGVSVSALQLLTATAALANGGLLMKPYLVQAITDSRGRLVESFKPQPVRRAVSPETARAMVEIMKGVVTKGGTATSAAMERYTVAGKTGTAQKVEAGSYAHGKYTSLFVGFAPADAPAVAILVAIDEPQKAHYGGVVAAPTFKRIAQETLDHLATPPEKEGQGFTASIAGEAKEAR